MNSDLEFCWGFECMCINLSPQCFWKGWGSRFPLGAPVPGLLLLSVFPQYPQSWFDCSLSDPWTWRFFILYHWWTWADSSGRTIFITAATLWFPTFFLNWGPSRTSICHGVTISSYLPDGEQFCSWTTKVLPIKLGHINKLSYVLCY